MLPTRKVAKNDAWGVVKKERQEVCSDVYVCQPHDGLATLSRCRAGGTTSERKSEKADWNRRFLV